MSKESDKTPTDSELNTIFTYAKFMFEAGQYEESCKALTFYSENSNSSDLSSSFGLLSSQILSGESSAAIKTIFFPIRFSLGDWNVNPEKASVDWVCALVGWQDNPTIKA